MSYDIKFKQRVVEYKKEGHTYSETCKVFKISERTLIRWINKEKEGKLGEVKIQVRKTKKIHPEKLIEYIQKYPDAYLVEIAQDFNCGECAIRKALKKLNITRKKKTTSYKEQCSEKVEKYLNEIKNFKEEDIVYIDETGIQGYVYREYARAFRGKKYKRTNIVAGKCGDKIISPLVYDRLSY